MKIQNCIRKLIMIHQLAGPSANTLAQYAYMAADEKWSELLCEGTLTGCPPHSFSMEVDVALFIYI